MTPQQLIAEVADEIEHLAGRPDSSARCRSALDQYLDEMSEVNLVALRDAYFAVPEHLRRYLLGDQDAKDWPLRVLITSIGDGVSPEYVSKDKELVQEAHHTVALNYFHRQREERRRWEATLPPWEDDMVNNPSVTRFDKHDGGHPFLSNDYPAPILTDGQTYSTVEHAYWALATSDPNE